MEKNLDHLTSEEVETLMQRYYAGESVSKLTKEYGISVRSSDLYKLFPPEAFANYICEYCDEPLVINRPSKTMELFGVRWLMHRNCILRKVLAKSMRQTVLLEPASDMPSVQKLMGGI